MALLLHAYWARSYCLIDPLEPFDCNPYDLMIFAFDGFASLLAPLFACLPFAWSFAVENAQGYHRQILIRAPLNRYLLAKVFVNALAGATAVAGPYLLVFVAGNLLYPRGLMDSSRMVPNNLPYGPFGWLYSIMPDGYVIYLVFSAFAFGGAYATLGLAISALTRNQYIASALPFLLFHIVALLLSVAATTWPGIDAWRPYNVFVPFHSPTATVYSTWGGLGIVAIGSIVAFVALTRRELLTL